MVAEIIAYGLFFLVITVIIKISITKKDDIWGGLIGNDGVLQISELVMLVWLILFIAMALGDLFFGLQVSVGLWTSMDLILGFTLFGKAYIQTHKKE